MTPAGWLIMLGSLAFVWGLAGWCFYRVVTRETTVISNQEEYGD